MAGINPVSFFRSFSFFSSTQGHINWFSIPSSLASSYFSKIAYQLCNTKIKKPPVVNQGMAQNQGMSSERSIPLRSIRKRARECQPHLGLCALDLACKDGPRTRHSRGRCTFMQAMQHNRLFARETSLSE